MCIDDYSRIAYAEVLGNEKTDTASGFLERAVGFYRSHGIPVQSVMTDNGGCYRSVLHAMSCKHLGITHIKTRPHTPQTNGKAERFIRTLLSNGHTSVVMNPQDNAPTPSNPTSTITITPDHTPPMEDTHQITRKTEQRV